MISNVRLNSNYGLNYYKIPSYRNFWTGCEVGHCIKYGNLTQFPCVEILWEGTVSAQFRMIRPKLYGNCACVFPQNLHTKKLGKMTVFYAVGDIRWHYIRWHHIRWHHIRWHYIRWHQFTLKNQNHFIKMNGPCIQSRNFFT